ncbi:hypothetical protein [Streptomyces sp. NPDC058657]|uniref:hypothetical protein n=1 Tax=unclassified Streptomyces TaxID=2593676 RepID=UPI00365D0A1F
MRRARPGAPPRGTAERALTSVGAGADFDDGGDSGHQNGENGSTTDTGNNRSSRTGSGGAGTQSGRETRTGPSRPEPEASRLWYITLSVSGTETPLTEVRRGLEQLAHDHPFLLTSRYAGDHAEIRYWEEARDLHDAAAVALRLWGEHRSTAQLPPWEIVGLEVIDRDTYHQRVAEGYGPPPAAPVGVHPY